MSRSQSFNISLKLLTGSFTNGIRNIKRQLNNFGTYLKSAFALGTVTAFGRKMIQTGAEFEDAMARVKAITNASTSEFKTMENEAKRLGATTKYTATEAANALENLTRNGMSANNAARALSSVLQLAQANAIGLAEAADIVTNTMNMFNLQVKDTQRINDVLSSTAANSATNITLLYEALVNAAPAAATLGFSVEETAAAIGALAQKGVKGADAGTQLRMALTKMADPKITKRMNELGVAINEDTMKSEGLIGTIKRLKDAQLSLTDLVAIFSQRGAVGIQQLINAYDDFEYLLEITQSSTGTTARMFQQGVGSTKKQLDTLKSTYESLLISISQKTGGVVNGAIRLLTNLVNNFKTVGGTIMNLASVVVPFLTKRILAAVTAFKALKAQAISTGVAIKTALGGWVTIIASVVTWVGTALVGAWNKANVAMKEADKAQKQLITDSNKTETIATSLINKLGPDTDKKTLAGIVKQLCELFPEFADAIRQAAIEANNTGEYDKLQEKLKAIVRLQSTIQAQAINKQSASAYTDRLGVTQKNNATAVNGGYSYLLKQSIKKRNDEFKGARIAIEDVFKDVASYVVNAANADEAGEMIYGYLNAIGVEFSKGASKALAEMWMKTGDYAKASEFTQKVADAANEIDSYNQAEAYAKKAAEDATNKEIEDAAKKAAVVEEEAKTQEKIAKVEDKLKQSISDVTDDLENGFIDSGQALARLTDAYKDAYEEFRSLTGKTKSDNPYFGKYKGLQSNEIGLRQALDKSFTESMPKIISKIPQAQAEAQTQYRLAQPKSENMVVGLDETVSELQLITDWSSMAINNVTNLANAFQTLNDGDATFLDKLQASLGIMQSMTGVLETINQLTKMNTALTEAQTVAEGENASTTIVGAIASLFKGNGEIPIAGIAIAAAGVAAMIAAISSAPKFAEGGIVGGNKMYGDMNIARVNSGEMILNGTQQKNLWKLINGQTSGNQPDSVQFLIKGKDLVASINNYNKSVKPTVSVL